MLTFEAIEEFEPGPRWAALFERHWPRYRAWFLHEGEAARTSYAASLRALQEHMPELVPTYEKVCALAGGGDLEARFLGDVGAAVVPRRLLAGGLAGRRPDPRPELRLRARAARGLDPPHPLGAAGDRIRRLRLGAARRAQRRRPRRLARLRRAQGRRAAASASRSSSATCSRRARRRSRRGRRCAACPTTSRTRSRSWTATATSAPPTSRPTATSC